jgi:hypothetical protein
MLKTMELRTEIEISAPPSEVWKTLMDFSAYPDWNPMLVSITGKAEAGSKITVVIASGGREWTIRPKVLAVNDGEEFRWKGHMVVPGLFDGSHFFRLIDLGDGRTRFIHGEDFSGILVKLMTGMLSDVARGFVFMNQALKRRVEGGAAPARDSR